VARNPQSGIAVTCLLSHARPIIDQPPHHPDVAHFRGEDQGSPAKVPLPGVEQARVLAHQSLHLAQVPLTRRMPDVSHGLDPAHDTHSHPRVACHRHPSRSSSQDKRAQLREEADGPKDTRSDTTPCMPTPTEG
jgi:hypothetical protein